MTIYALSDYGLVVSAEYKKRGTWAGATEELKREEARPVFVRIEQGVPPGNSKLLALGAIAWPNQIDRDNFRQQLDDLAVNAVGRQPRKKNPSLFDFQASQKQVADATLLADEPVEEQPKLKESKAAAGNEAKPTGRPDSIYQAVLPIILHNLDSPVTAGELAELLDINKKQLYIWLKRVLGENKVSKLSRPVRYVVRRKEK